MRIGVALFGEEVSPRFDHAGSLLMATIIDREVVERSTVDLGDAWIPSRLEQLGALGIAALLCGGFDRVFLPHAERLGIRVYWNLSGPAEEALRDFIAGRLLPEGAARPPRVAANHRRSIAKRPRATRT